MAANQFKISQSEREELLRSKHRLAEFIEGLDFNAIRADASRGRDKYAVLEAYGFFLDRTAGGDHNMYVNSLFKAYADQNGIELGQNLWNVRTSKQVVGMESVDDGGDEQKQTWQRAVKRMSATLDMIEARAAEQRQRRKLSQIRTTMRESFNRISDIRRTARQSYKSLGAEAARSYIASQADVLAVSTATLQACGDASAIKKMGAAMGLTLPGRR